MDPFTLSMIMSVGQQSSVASFAVWVVLGLLVGFIVGKIFSNGLGVDCMLGIVGAIVGGFLANLIGKLSGSGLDQYSELVAVFSAVAFLFIYHTLSRRRRFQSMRSR